LGVNEEAPAQWGAGAPNKKKNCERAINFWQSPIAH
jgi:hypothetical protein